MPTLPWSRQGARNIAGVTYQVAVSAYLLILGKGNLLPILSVTPEGTEDVDCLCKGGSYLLVQTKERADGDGTLTLGMVAQIMDHALPAIRARSNSIFALVTNAQLGLNLSFTGWGTKVADVFEKEAAEELLSSIPSKQIAEEINILKKAAIVSIERNLNVACIQHISQIYNISPSVAGLVYSYLLEDLGEVAAAQRGKTANNAVTRHLSDLDAIVRRVTEIVDVGQLDQAIQVGIIEPLDFTRVSALEQENFLIGVDVTPAHISADLDVPRPLAEGEIAAGLREEGYVVIAGASGSGKSSLLWRTAKKCDLCVRKVKVLRLQSEDIPNLLRWVRLQVPSKFAPLLICADNLGRQRMNGWVEAVSQLRDIPGVVLLGAVRREDFDSNLVATAPRIVEPVLDIALAESIADALRKRGVVTRLDSIEAFNNSEQLLMEFLSLLLSGNRMREVVSAQIKERFAPERQTEREILRYVCAAHCLGLCVPADVLEQLLGKALPADFYQAIARLKKEHLLTQNDQTEWVGLHELRSQIINEVLHSLPPPTASITYMKVFEALPIEFQSTFVRRYAYYSEIPLTWMVSSTVKAINASAALCSQATVLCEALRESDSVEYARICLQVVNAIPDPSGLSPYTKLLFAILAKEKGVKLPFNSTGFDSLIQALPSRPPSKLAKVLGQIESKRIIDWAKELPHDTGVIWLELLEEYLSLTEADVADIWTAYEKAKLPTRIRVVAAITRLAQLKQSQLEQIAGSVQERAEELARSHLFGISAQVSVHPEDGLVITVRMLISSEGDLHAMIVDMARQILSYCPEASIAEVITIDSARRQHSVDGHPHGYKRIPRKNLPRLTENRLQTDFFDTLYRILAAPYWTNRLRIEAKVALELEGILKSLPSHVLNQYRNQRRFTEWKARIDSVRAIVIPPCPGEKLDRNTQDPIRRALEGICMALQQLANQFETASCHWAGIASQLRGALPDLESARQEARPTLSSIGDTLPFGFEKLVRHIADLLFVVADNKSLIRSLKNKNVAEALIESENLVAQQKRIGLAAEQSCLKQLCKGFGDKCSITLRSNYDPKAVHLLSDEWIIRMDVDYIRDLNVSFQIPDEMRLQISFRVCIVFAINEYVLPFTGLRIGNNCSFPLGAEVVSKICKELGWKKAISPYQADFSRFINDLIEASRFSSIYWIRPNSWRRSEDLQKAEDLVRSAKSTIESIPNEDIKNYCFALVEKVVKEDMLGGPYLAAPFSHFPALPEDAAFVQEIGGLTLAVANLDLQFPHYS